MTKSNSKSPETPANDAAPHIAGKTSKLPEHTQGQGQSGNTEQNTHHQGYQQDR